MIYTRSMSKAQKRGALGLVLGLFAGIILTLFATQSPFIRDAKAVDSSASSAGTADGGTSDVSSGVAEGSPSGADTAAGWQLQLINEKHPLNPDYAPPGLTQIDAEHSVDSRIAADLQAMLADGAAQGLRMYVVSAYRPYETQAELFNSGMQSRMDGGLAPLDAYQATKSSVALPGASEHQAGLAVDIIASAYPELDERQGDTPEQQWLMAHCQEYGFILRYPKDTQAITGITYEPWHYRYVGREAAQEISERQITLEEYVESLSQKPGAAAK